MLLNVKTWVERDAHTRGDIVIRVDGYAVGEFGLVDCFEDGEPLTDGGDSNCFEGLWVQHAQHLSRDAVFCIARGELYKVVAMG